MNTEKTDLEFLQDEEAELEKLLDELDDDRVFERESLKGRLTEVREEIELLNKPIKLASAPKFTTNQKTAHNTNYSQTDPFELPPHLKR